MCSWGIRRRRIVERVVYAGPAVEVNSAYTILVYEKCEIQSIFRIYNPVLHISLANSYIGKLFAYYAAAVLSDV